ncbi:MAG TPA: phosphatidylserine/phosphatidylglycerophosphate/cardiolipin synthase family protein [Kofleriaceae bacterium]|nr:phosphatidylserine/phosphatidylglycerophosphate/cardiolipin synthase family protein [Kofleriaceae bacterium]
MTPPAPASAPPKPKRQRPTLTQRLRGNVPRSITDPPSTAIAVQLPAPFTRYARSAQRWRPGEVEVLRDGGQTYPAMLTALAAAERSICFETYILAADRTGDRFKAVLAERARAGVAVRIIYDAVGSFGLPVSWVDDLRAAGCEVIDFNPIAPWRRRFRLSHRDHRKVIVVDDRVGFTGGLNIADDYAALEDGGVGWHDMHCRVTGAVVVDLARMFRRTWLRSGGKDYRSPSAPTSDYAPTMARPFIRLIENTLRRQRTAVRRAYLHVIKNAQRRVLIQNAYFLPDRGLRRALIRAAERGVDVRVMVPGHSDVRMVGYASLYIMRRLAHRGVKMFLWRGPMMHAKTATVDDAWSTIGSYNFDAQSRFNNLEVTVEILDAATASTLALTFERDMAHAEQFDERAWKQLPWWSKVMAWIGFRLRRLL